MQKSILYYKGQYDSNHWAMLPCNEKINIAIVDYTLNSETMNFSIDLNPTDKRGYRIIIRLINLKNMRAAFNRPYTAYEWKALYDLGSLMSGIYTSFGLIAQFSCAGNNSHVFEQDGTVKIGNDSEPNILHMHVWGRGDPRQNYIEGVPLDGPPPGKEFNMRGSVKNEQGNDKKIEWNDSDLEKVRNFFRKKLSTTLLDLKDLYPHIQLQEVITHSVCPSND